MADSIPSTEIEWRPVVGFPDYEISEDGRIRRVGKPRPGYPHKHELIPWVFDRYGHMTIRLTVNGKRYTRAVHRLVAETFIGPRPTPRHGVAHWDGNPAHNHWKNLRWATQAENAADTVRHGRTNAGEKNPSAKVTAAQVAEIRKRYATGHERICDLAAEFDMHYVNMSNLLHGKSWRKNGTPVSRIDARMAKAKEALALLDRHGNSPTKAAKAIGIPKSTFFNRLLRAKKLIAASDG